MKNKEKIQIGILENVLGYLLAQASISTNKIFKENIVSQYHLNKLEFTTLILIKNNANLTLKNLVKILNIPASNLSLLLVKLEEHKLITRNKSSVDQRIQILHLTQSGKKITTKLEQTSLEMESKLFKNLENDEREQLFILLKKLIH